MQVVKVIHFNSMTNTFEPTALVKVPAHQTGFHSGDTDALEYAFTRTQNIFGSWSKGPTFEDGETNEDFSENVVPIAPLPTYMGRTLGHRSSMVGDLFVVDGKIYICKILGFELYEKEFA
jgi:hypothetical protein